jgi:prevent-host-death family protein
MQRLPQMASVTDLRNDYTALLARLRNGPIVLSQRSRPAAVLVSPDEWDETAQLIKDLQEQLNRERRLRLSNQRYAARLADPSRGVTQEQLDQQLAEAGPL